MIIEVYNSNSVRHSNSGTPRMTKATDMRAHHDRVKLVIVPLRCSTRHVDQELERHATRGIHRLAMHMAAQPPTPRPRRCCCRLRRQQAPPPARWRQQHPLPHAVGHPHLRPPATTAGRRCARPPPATPKPGPNNRGTRAQGREVMSSGGTRVHASLLPHATGGSTPPRTWSCALVATKLITCSVNPVS